MNSRIRNCYDSHTHFLATGQIAEGLQLRELKSASDVADLKIKPGHYRQQWLTGFGWDENSWQGAKLPTKKILDDIFPNEPVIFSRIDGHSSWLNSCAIETYKSKDLIISAASEKSGLLFEHEHFQALSLLPAYTSQQLEIFFETAQRIFNQAGFTHLRDLTMNLNEWLVLCDMQSRERLSVCVDAFVTAKTPLDLDTVLREITEMKKSNSPYLRVHGVKIFVDGSLGSQTAFVSENYLDSNQGGSLLWAVEDIKNLLRKTWQAGFDVATHTIGDQAAHVVVMAAREVSAEGISGRLHLEHVEVLRGETVQLMKPLHVTCHLQPSHWLSDRHWLKKTLSAELCKNIFPWESLRKNKIPFFFGSDSPIEKPSLFTTRNALNESAKNGVPALSEDWMKHHSHPDQNWTNSFTELNNEKIIQVYFDGKPLI